MPRKHTSKNKDAEEKYTAGVDYGEPFTNEPPSRLLEAGIAEIQRLRPRLKSGRGRGEWNALERRGSGTHAERVGAIMRASDERRNFVLNARDEEREEEIKRLRQTYGKTRLWPEIERRLRFSGRQWEIPLPEHWFEQLENLKNEFSSAKRNANRRRIRQQFAHMLVNLIGNWLDENPELSEQIALYDSLFEWRLPVVLNFVGQEAAFRVYLDRIGQSVPWEIVEVARDEQDPQAVRSCLNLFLAEARKKITELSSADKIAIQVPSAYFYSTVRNVARQLLRKRKAQKRIGTRVSLELWREIPASEEPDQFAFVEVKRLYQAAENRWPEKGPRFLDALKEGKTVAEASKEAGISRITGQKYKRELRKIRQ